MKLTYKQRIFGYFLLIFAAFTVIVILFEQKEERKYRTASLETRLGGYVEMLHSYIRLHPANGDPATQVKEFTGILPPDLRVSCIGKDGTLLWDNDLSDIHAAENHLDRPEILKAFHTSEGSNIRVSASTGQEYIYFARFYDDYYIRVALPFTAETRSLLQSDSMFVYMMLFLFAVALFFINYAAGRFSRSILQLRQFSAKIRSGHSLPEQITFPEDELGEIGSELKDIFAQMERNKREVEIEREKLIRHFRFSEDGLGIFTAGRKTIYANTNFIQHLNHITDKLTFEAIDAFDEPKFQPMMDFISHPVRSANNISFQIQKNGKVFSVKVILFEDKSFEINLKDVTKTEKTRLLKQEMTSNIAHELRTPVTSLRGYLEILKDQQPDPDRQKLFIERAYLQSLRLSNLIEDVSLISKIEDAPSRFALEPVNLFQLVSEVRIDLADKLQKDQARLHIRIDPARTVTGNYTLLQSIFRNLIDNSVSYAGQGIDIYIDNYQEDDQYLYFLYYDNGKGVGEEHLNRLFERFYRISEGRTRDTGGSGLGLSIVKNAVLFHKGEIQVKNHAGGGLEFHFTLKKQG